MWLDFEMTEDQVEFMRLKYINHMLMESMNDASGKGTTTNLVDKKLDMFGNVNLHYSMINYKKKKNMIRNKLQLASPISEVYRMYKADAKDKKNV